MARKVEDRAMLTLPWFLSVSQSKIDGAGLGVFTSTKVCCCLIFGPYQGAMVVKSVNCKESGYGWQIKNINDKPLCVDAADPSVSNWMRYVNCARTLEEINLAALQYKGQIYYRTTRDILR